MNGRTWAAPVGTERLQGLEPLFPHLAPYPTAVDEGTTACSETVARNSDAPCVEFALLCHEVCLARLELCLSLGKFGVGAGGTGSGGGVCGGEGREGGGAEGCKGGDESGGAVGVARGFGGFDETGDTVMDECGPRDKGGERRTECRGHEGRRRGRPRGL